MKKVSAIIFIVAVALIIYGYWGAFTQSGNKIYDEMDALLPFFVLIFGVFLIIVFLVLFFIMKRKSKAKKIDKQGNLKGEIIKHHLAKNKSLLP